MYNFSPTQAANTAFISEARKQCSITILWPKRTRVFLGGCGLSETLFVSLSIFQLILSKPLLAVGKAILFSENDFIKNRANGTVFPFTESSTKGVSQYENLHLYYSITFSFLLTTSSQWF